MAADSSSHQQHEFYFVAYPFLNLPDWRLAEREFAKNRRIRSEILDILRAKRTQRKEVLEKVKLLVAEEKSCEERCSEISKRFNFKNIPTNARKNSNIFSCEAEIDLAVKRLESQIMYERNTRIEENHLLKQIKDLERSREQMLSTEYWSLQKKLKHICNKKKQLRNIESQIRSLENDLQYYNYCMDEFYPYLDQIRTHRYQNNELSLQLRAVRDDAIYDFYRANHNISVLENRSRLEVEKFMRMWNGNKEFREEYEQRKLMACTA